MTKHFLFAVVLVSVALWTGCAKGLGSTPAVKVHDDNGHDDINQVPVTVTLQFTATVTGTNNTAVNWSLSGNSCTGSGNPCGTINSSGLYTAPATVPPSPTVTITATSQQDVSGKGQFTITIKNVTVSVAPTPVNVAKGLTQQFTAAALPDLITPQKFTWAVSCVQGGAACGSVAQDTSVSGLAVYTAPAGPPTGCTTANNCVQVTATSTIDPTGVGTAKVLVQNSRVIPSAYAFRFNAYDNSGNAVALAGTVSFAADGTVTGGVEDEIVATGPSKGHHQFTITSGSYAPSSAGDNTNNAGTLTLNAAGASITQFQAVVDGAGSLRMIESDGNGTGSGSMEKTGTQFNSAAQEYAFGFTGVDSSGNRVGYAGLVPIDGSGNINSGLLDPNDNGTTNNVCGAPPCHVAGTYAADGSISGLWHMTLTTGITQHFDFFVGSGATSNVKNPITLYAISTDPIDPTHPALSGRMVFQDPATTYDKTALNSDSVSHLTGVGSGGTLVSLVEATGDGNGNLNNQVFDSNNAGTIVAAATQPATCTYTTDASSTGRYVVTLLGTGSNCAGGIPFVLYASGANRGFLLDQSSGAVMAGAMDPQTGAGGFGGSSLPGTYAAGTVSNASSAVTPLVANLLFTSPGNNVFNVSGTQYPGPVPLTGTYTVMAFGTGTIPLTTPSANYVFYVTDTSHFEMIDVDPAVTNPAVIFAQQ